jgi:hypothetical protein
VSTEGGECGCWVCVCFVTEICEERGG